MKRLRNWQYDSPFYYMVTIKRLPERLTLIKYVDLLKRFLTRTCREHMGVTCKVFDDDWHDLIVKKVHQLDCFHHYILDNPKMALLRQSHRDLFYCYRGYTHWRLGELVCDLVGNPELLNEPVFLNVRLSRSIVQGSAEWQKHERYFGNWRPGGTAVGTWWSPAEKMAAGKILENGGNIVYLAPHGFYERWHPVGERAQRLCAEGRVLYLSPYSPHSAKLPPGETRNRCLALNDLAREMAERVLVRRSLTGSPRGHGSPCTDCPRAAGELARGSLAERAQFGAPLAELRSLR